MVSLSLLAGMSALHWAVDGGHEGVVYHALNEEGLKVLSLTPTTPTLCVCVCVCVCVSV